MATLHNKVDLLWRKGDQVEMFREIYSWKGRRICFTF